MVELIDLIDTGALSVTMGKTVLEEAFEHGDPPGKIVEARGYAQISDASVVETAVTQALEANPKAVEDYLGGKESAAGFLVGQVMRLTQGQANPGVVQQLVKEKLETVRNA